MRELLRDLAQTRGVLVHLVRMVEGAAWRRAQHRHRWRVLLRFRVGRRAALSATQATWVAWSKAAAAERRAALARAARVGTGAFAADAGARGLARMVRPWRRPPPPARGLQQSGSALSAPSSCGPRASCGSR